MVRRYVPRSGLRVYHYLLAFAGAVWYGFPSRKITVIGVTGTSGKSTTVDFLARIFEEAGYKTASASSVRFRIGGQEEKNNLKMTMPGRFFIQKFLRRAVREGCRYAVLEATSEGISQSRHRFIRFDAAVFTNLSPEHLEAHGGFERYRAEKLKLFQATKNLHIVNADDANAKYFLDVPARKIITFGLERGDVTARQTDMHLQLLGNFNQYNALAAVAAASAYGIPLAESKKTLERIASIPGRMEVVAAEPFLVVVDYAHTPEQLEKVYQSLSNSIELDSGGGGLVCVLGSCGGGRDRWKRPVLGKIASQYCREVIVTNEDPYDENPQTIIDEVASGFPQIPNPKHQIPNNTKVQTSKLQKILDRREAIKRAISLAAAGDTVIITGKGSESRMCLANGKKIPWDDRAAAREAMAKITGKTSRT